MLTEIDGNKRKFPRLIPSKRNSGTFVFHAQAYAEPHKILLHKKSNDEGPRV